MDPDVLTAAFRAHTEGKPLFTRRMAILIGLFLGEPPRVVVWNLEAIGLLRPGSWTWFRTNGGITQAHIDEVMRDLQIEERL